MKQATYGVLKWLQRRYSNDESLGLIVKYGQVNNIKEVPYVPYTDIVSEYIQDTGFTLFTSWIKAHYENVKANNGKETEL